MNTYTGITGADSPSTVGYALPLNSHRSFNSQRLVSSINRVGT